MALVPDVIKANEALKELTDDQVAAIATLSVNDENAVISAKVGELQGGYDKDIKEVSGIEKNQGEKSYDYAKRVLGDFKTKAEATTTLTEEVNTHKEKIKGLEKQIADGNTDPALKQQLKDATDKAGALQTKYDTDKGVWDKEKEEFGSQLTGVKVNSQFEKAEAGLKFKPEYPEPVQKTLLKSAKEGILAEYKTDFTGEEGKKVMVFRGADGEIARNPANKQEPFTAQELMASKLEGMLDVGKNTPGGGTDPKGDGSDPKVTLTDLSGAKTQVEADKVISKYLAQKGITRGSREFSEEQKKIREENKVADLPIR